MAILPNPLPPVNKIAGGQGTYTSNANGQTYVLNPGSSANGNSTQTEVLELRTEIVKLRVELDTLKKGAQRDRIDQDATNSYIYKTLKDATDALADVSASLEEMRQAAIRASVALLEDVELESEEDSLAALGGVLKKD